MVERSWATSEQIEIVLDALLSAAHLVQPIRFRQGPALPDPNDDMVLECALEVGASAIVTTNLLDFDGVTAAYRLKVVKPGALVAKLRKEEQ